VTLGHSWAEMDFGRLLKAGTFALALGVLAACAPTAKTKGPDLAAEQARLEAQRQADEEARRAAEAEAARKAAAAAQPMRIALMAPMTGPNASVGQAIANAATLATLDLNSPRLRLVVYDTGAAEITSLARRAITEGSHLILGPLFGQEARAIAPIARESGVPVLTFSNDAAVAGNGVYVLGFQPAQEVARVISFAKQRGLNRFALLAPDGEYGERVSSAFTSAVRGAEASVAGVVTFPRDRAQLFAPARRITNYDARLNAARGAAEGKQNPDGSVPTVASVMPGAPFDALMIAENGPLVKAFVSPLRQFGVSFNRVRLLGTGLWATDATMPRDPTLVGGWFASVPDGNFNQMARRFQSSYGYVPRRLASLGYDGVLLAGAALRSWTPGKPVSTASLQGQGGFAGVDGIFRFRSNGVAERGLEVQEFTGSGLRTISAAPSSFAAARTSSVEEPVDLFGPAQPREMALVR
jgi:branched-chain amino acid transport system substrate-binding protein